MVSFEACGGGEAFGRKQTAPPCYGKAVDHLTRHCPLLWTRLSVSIFIGVLTIFAEATPMKIVVMAFTTTLMLAEAKHATDKTALICSDANGRLFALHRFRPETRQLPHVRPCQTLTAFPLPELPRNLVSK